MAKTKKAAFEPLGMITCTSSDCKKELHCFKKTKRSPHPPGSCRDCGAKLVDWDHLHLRDPLDVDGTFAALKSELIRHHFWHISLTQRAINYALRKGARGLRDAVRHRIETSVGPEQPVLDGQQTPRETSTKANAVHFAQHATASCCRICIEYWHGIPMGQRLTPDEIDYLSLLAIRYLECRLPDLPEDPQKVAAIRTRVTGASTDRKAA